MRNDAKKKSQNIRPNKERRVGFSEKEKMIKQAELTAGHHWEES